MRCYLLLAATTASSFLLDSERRVHIFVAELRIISAWFAGINQYACLPFVNLGLEEVGYQYPSRRMSRGTLMRNFPNPKTKLLALSVVLSGSLVVPSVSSQAPATSPQASAGSTATPSTHSASNGPRYRPSVSNRARDYYQLIWGVDSLTVRSVESGELIRFNYRVVDPDKAQALNDKKSEPSLIDPKAGVKLVVPSLEKVGQLRQSSAPEVGKVYWMAFSNKGGRVKRGDQVTIVIGKFRADGLVVE